MKIAYFDCFSGISGNMLLGALIDLGLEVDLLKKELNKLNLDDWDLTIKKVNKGVIGGTLAEVINSNDGNKSRQYKDIVELIDKSTLAGEVRDWSRRIFYALARAEAKVHNTAIEHVHFHEVGAVDSIIDVVGCVIGIGRLGIEKIYSSHIHVGRGFIECSHGTLPVPAPATAELLVGVPVYSRGYNQELVTPTGAAIITTYARGFGTMPLMKIERVGYGANSKELDIPHLLRVFAGEEVADEDNNIRGREYNLIR